MPKRTSAPGVSNVARQLRGGMTLALPSGIQTGFRLLPGANRGSNSIRAADAACREIVSTEAALAMVRLAAAGLKP